uniref:CSON009340 protein n=1 Tax=Culicoides sonorensis TaxID=179676 RepID=A0A336KFM9_CULSO
MNSNNSKNSLVLDNHTLFLMSIHNPEIDHYRLAYLVTGIIMAISMTLGNAFVLILFYQERSNLKNSHKFVISLALCDIITGFIFMLAQLYKFDMKVSVSNATCPWILAIMVAIYQTSMYVLTISSIDRYWAIVHPLHYRVNATKIRINVMIIFSWAIPFSFGITHLLTHKKPLNPDLVCLMSDDIFNEYLLTILMLSMAFNMISIITFYILIHRAIARVFRARNEGFFAGAFRIITQNNEIDDEKTSEGMSETTMRISTSGKPTTIKTREIRSTLLLLLIVTFALIAFLPGSLNTIANTINPKTFSMGARLTCYLLLTINSIVNPIYTHLISKIYESQQNDY